MVDGHTARHLFHLIAGCVAPLLGLALPRKALLPFFGAVALIFVSVETARLFYRPFNRWLASLFRPVSQAFKAGESVRPIGSTFFLVASFLNYLLFPRDIAVAALFFTAVGDAAAAMVGERYGRMRLGRKSIEGSVAFFASAAVVGAILIRFGLRLSKVSVALGAIVAALVELLSTSVDDNFTVPTASAAMMSYVLRRP